MDTESELLQKRLEAKEEILALKEQIPSARIFNRLGKAFKHKSLGYWLSNVVLLHLILISPALLIGLTLKDSEKLIPVFVGGMLATEGAILSLIVGHIAVQNILEDIANRIVTKIISANDLLAMLLWLKQSWSTQNISAFVLPYCLLWVLLAVISNSVLIHQFVGIGFSLWCVFVGWLAGIVLHMYTWTCLLVSTLKSYQYEMNALAPADSEIISDISEMLTRAIYMLAGLSAVLTLEMTLSLEALPIFVFPILVIGWSLILAQFLLTRSTLSAITNRAKWNTLKKIQTKINAIEETGDLSDKDTAERLFRLADIHKQIMASRSNTLDWKSFSTLFSQLMLPLLGLLLGNLDKLLKLFP